MNCSQAINYIHSLEHFGIKPGLERITALCDALGNPQNSLKFVHVAGTNGKGSTSTMIAAVLQQAAYKTGLYTSPYVIDFRERIQVNGSMIEPEDLARIVDKVKSVSEALPAEVGQVTEFEFITAAAFLYFKEADCDFVVLEVGLGGRFDATNVIGTPAVSVITSISKDHTAILGNTLSEIAFEKCGIIKEGGSCVSYPCQEPEAFSVIEKACSERNCSLTVPDLNKLSIFSDDYGGTTFEYGSVKARLALTGEHMVKNAVTAVEAVHALKKSGFSVADDEDISKGFSSVVMPARTEIISTDPLVILDGGHNEGCGEALSAYLGRYLQHRRIIAVCSMMADKDYNAYLKLVCAHVSTFIASKTNVPRTLSAEELRCAASSYCASTFAYDNPAEAIAFAKSIADENDVLLFCGSFYFAGEIRDKLKEAF